ncbi:hypothetical protein HK101_006322 [Irineochytrium annulatum]|nr:hypothetical protein HK101_006322 [Irineochytrium annulatum]
MSSSARSPLASLINVRNVLLVAAIVVAVGALWAASAPSKPRDKKSKRKPTTVQSTPELKALHRKDSAAEISGKMASNGLDAGNAPIGRGVKVAGKHDEKVAATSNRIAVANGMPKNPLNRAPVFTEEQYRVPPTRGTNWPVFLDSPSVASAAEVKVAKTQLRSAVQAKGHQDNAIFKGMAFLPDFNEIATMRDISALSFEQVYPSHLAFVAPSRHASASEPAPPRSKFSATGSQHFASSDASSPAYLPDRNESNNMSRIADMQRERVFAKELSFVLSEVANEQAVSVKDAFPSARYLPDKNEIANLEKVADINSEGIFPDDVAFVVLASGGQRGPEKFLVMKCYRCHLKDTSCNDAVPCDACRTANAPCIRVAIGKDLRDSAIRLAMEMRTIPLAAHTPPVEPPPQLRIKRRDGRRKKTKVAKLMEKYLHGINAELIEMKK